jgi:hypothetical protein
MPNGRNTWLFLLAVALLAVFVWGLGQVAVAPLQTGEVYPPYSSLRSDPLGAMALFESLAAMPDLSVERLYKPRAMTQGSHAAILVLGVNPVAWAELEAKTLEEYENVARDGERLVIAFLPVSAPGFVKDKHAVEGRWNIKLSYRKPARGGAPRGTIPRHSALYFDPGPEWRTLEASTAVERTFGAGSIVLLADSYPLSNEGLREERNAKLIAGIIGPARRILFDENHFGVVETGSVTKLMRKYRLEGAVAVVALVTALFLWRSVSSFLPPRQIRSAEAVAGRDSLEGLSNLLRRGVSEKMLLDTCYAEWARSAPRESRAALVEAEIARTGKRNPVEAYRAACRVISAPAQGEKR